MLLGKICAVVGDDAVWNAVPGCNVGNECHGSRAIQLLDRLSFDPLGELVYSDKQMCHAAARRLEWSDHVQSPDGKGPSDGDGLECRSRQVLLGAEDLSPSAVFD